MSTSPISFPAAPLLIRQPAASPATKGADLLAQVPVYYPLPKPQPLSNFTRPVEVDLRSNRPTGDSGIHVNSLDGARFGQGPRPGTVIAYPASIDVNLVTPVAPTKGPAKETVLYVNGVNATLPVMANTLAILPDRLNANVLPVYNGTWGNGGRNVFTNPGIIADFIQAGAQNIFGVAYDPAVASVRDAVLDRIQAGLPVHIVTHSQGTITTGAALAQVQSRLREIYGREQGDRLFAGIKVETFGGMFGQSMPSGPKYIHYVNRPDPFMRIALPDYNILNPDVGQPISAQVRSPETGRGAVVIYLDVPSPDPKDPVEAHRIPLYSHYRLDAFDRIYGLYSKPGSEPTKVDYAAVVQRLRRP